MGKCNLFFSGHSSHQVKLVVSAHARHVDQPVRQSEECANRADVPDVCFVKAEFPQAPVIVVIYSLRLARHLERIIEHDLLPLRDVGLAVVGRQLIGYIGVFGANPQNCTVRDDAVLALIARRSRDYDHFAFGLVQSRGFLFHQRVVIGEEGSKLVGTPGQRKENIGYKTGFLGNGFNALAHILGQAVELGYREATDRVWIQAGPRKITIMRYSTVIELITLGNRIDPDTVVIGARGMAQAGLIAMLEI